MHPIPEFPKRSSVSGPDVEEVGCGGCHQRSNECQLCLVDGRNGDGNQGIETEASAGKLGGGPATCPRAIAPLVEGGESRSEKSDQVENLPTAPLDHEDPVSLSSVCARFPKIQSKRKALHTAAMNYLKKSSS